MTRLELIIEDLERRVKTIGCGGRSGLLLYLEELGFNAKSGKSDNHKVLTHPELSRLSEFRTIGIDCGHGTAKSVKPCYGRTVLSTLKKYKEELEIIYKANNHV
ncbi:hypothetical protein I5398_11940 [Citrobacter freundii]|uniref:hypothetical protein n=1 Tax=Citrobacter TaxID=544 RepID=UPI001D8175A6|nr:MULTISPECIES: hypothetical protein [Citrobacter]MBJ8796739.1 hypothetical protein [Citrobacter freundii]MDM2915102.1 hypothetical protein [Citrobacter sp. Cpo035]MDV1612780.1 hypothetical protein [Citrobacter portucalensis]MEB0546920.1 hypothetical protein [Citrobacter portucalensis]